LIEAWLLPTLSFLKNTVENQEVLLLALKLVLAPLAVWLASVASRRYGHVIGGVLSGFPMIAAPVTAALLIDHSAEHVASIAFATVGGLVATLAFIIAFSWTAKIKQPWCICLCAAAIAFIGMAALMQTLLQTLLQALNLPTMVLVALGFCAPWLARALLPQLAPPNSAPVIPSAELILRLIGAFVMATALILSAGQTPAWLSGLLIAWPITGSILPCFTQRLSGPNATVAFFSGFTRGLTGLAVFFCILGFLLPVFSKVTAYALALGSAALVAWGLARRYELLKKPTHL
jgi:hypothetical protein